MLHINGSVPQGALIGLEAFCEMTMDLTLILPLFKYVEDSTTYDIFQNNETSDRLQHVIDQEVTWRSDNDMINISKTNEMIMSCTKAREFPTIDIDSQELERAITTKVFGMYIQNGLKWDTHVDHMVSRAKSKLYFMTF